MKIVEIFWIDAYGDDAMLSASDYIGKWGEMIRSDVGYLVGEDESHYHIAPQIIPQKHDVLYRHFMSIPKVCVRQLKVLRK